MTEEREPAGGTLPAARMSGPWVEWRERRDRPFYTVRLWPHRSLTPGVRRAVFAVFAIGLALPLAGLVGTLAFWGMVPFLALPIGFLWLGLRRNDRDARLNEELTLWPDEIRVVRREPSGRELRWSAEPRRVRLRLQDGPVESYLTLVGGGREIELGRFLSPPERRDLADELEAALSGALRA